MRKLRIGIIDLVSKCPTRTMWARVMNANFASIMPQAIAVWCQEEGHRVTYLCYTGLEDLAEELPADVDMVFIGADKTITKIHKRVKASALGTPEDAVARASGEAQFVLELPAGAGARYKLREAQKLSFDVVIPPR